MIGIFRYGQWKPGMVQASSVFSMINRKLKHYGFDVYVHYQIGPDGSQFLDLTKCLEPDPIWIQRLRAGISTQKLDSKAGVGLFD